MKKIYEKGIPAGNFDDKYRSKNPISNYLVKNFKNTIINLLDCVKDDFSSVAEYGCGEGEIIRLIYDRYNLSDAKAFDFSSEILKIASTNNANTNISFYEKSIYDVNTDDSAELIICCEVLEHLEDYAHALEKMSKLKAKYFLFSVPNEPIWRILNMARFKYLKNLGNTPGHINHWSSKSFVKLIENYFDIIYFKKPFPWTMVLVESKT